MQPTGVHTPFAGKINVTARDTGPMPAIRYGSVRAFILAAPLLPDRAWNALTVRQFPLVRSRLR
jgi:hypothetical protein